MFTKKEKSHKSSLCCFIFAKIGVGSFKARAKQPRPISALCHSALYSYSTMKSEVIFSLYLKEHQSFCGGGGDWQEWDGGVGEGCESGWQVVHRAPGTKKEEIGLCEPQIIVSGACAAVLPHVGFKLPDAIRGSLQFNNSWRDKEDKCPQLIIDTCLL